MYPTQASYILTYCTWQLSWTIHHISSFTVCLESICHLHCDFQLPFHWLCLVSCHCTSFATQIISFYLFLCEACLPVCIHVLYFVSVQCPACIAVSCMYVAYIHSLHLFALWILNSLNTVCFNSSRWFCVLRFVYLSLSLSSSCIHGLKSFN